MATFKLQSAMEYLMTYGWAILIIAIVLGALFGLGFFNGTGLTPTTTGGSCQVYRSGGPFSTSFINTEGACNNQLPRYVAQFTATSGQYVQLTSTGAATGASGINTVSFWVDDKAAATATVSAFSFNGAGAGSIGTSGTACFGVLGGPAAAGVSTGFTNTWIYITAIMYPTALSANDVLYVNGAPSSAKCSPAGAAGGATASAYIGAGTTGTAATFNGMVSNVQIYNYSMPVNDISAMYAEGIGGVPLALQNLVGWWPLNGNPNDYSGDLQNGAIGGTVVFTNSWSSGYSAP